MARDAHELLKAIASGDEQALAELYDAYAAAINGVVLRMLGDAALAEEALQDTFLRVWRGAADYDPSKGRPFTWMVNIARNRAIDMLRSSEVRKAQAIQGLDRAVYRLGSGDGHADVESADLKGSLGRLRPEHRQLIDMAYYQGYSQQEIAHATGIPLGTVKSRTRAALAELRELLKDHR
ncbi:MAG: sigma-70 family RNA polymerase sigma factor [Flavobacteriales bacterium]